MVLAEEIVQLPGAAWAAGAAAGRVPTAVMATAAVPDRGAGPSSVALPLQ